MIDFVLFFVINEVRWGLCEGGTMCFGLRRRDHVLRFADKKIEARHGKHRVFSMWKGVGVGRRGEIVPEQFRKVRGVWV